MQTDTPFSSRKSILSVSAELLMSFGEHLYRWRKAKGLTQTQLAAASGVNVSYISNLERDFSATTKSGRPRPSESLCSRFAKVLDVSESEVREAAGYSSIEGTPLQIAPSVSIKLADKNLTPEEQKEIAEELAFAYEIIMRRRAERAEKGK